MQDLKLDFQGKTVLDLRRPVALNEFLDALTQNSTPAARKAVGELIDMASLTAARPRYRGLSYGHTMEYTPVTSTLTVIFSQTAPREMTLRQKAITLAFSDWLDEAYDEALEGMRLNPEAPHQLLGSGPAYWQAQLDGTQDAEAIFTVLHTIYTLNFIDGLEDLAGAEDTYDLLHQAYEYDCLAEATGRLGIGEGLTLRDIHNELFITQTLPNHDKGGHPRWTDADIEAAVRTLQKEAA